MPELTAQVASDPQAALVPRTRFEGSTLEFDFPAVHVGVAEYEEGPTGATAFYFPEGAMAAGDARRVDGAAGLAQGEFPAP